MDLFEKDRKQKGTRRTPLADRMRPQTLDEFLGQKHILEKGSVLRRAIEEDKIQSAIFWGPPGTGKTTLAHVIAKATGAHFVSFSAVLSGIKEIKGVMAEATRMKEFYNRKTILFVDEVHRFNKAQQDAFLPHVEKGNIILIGATTENPSFEVISALLSRTKVYTLNPLKEDELKIIIKRAIKDKERGLGNLGVELEDKALDYIAQMANGDARIVLSTLEFAVLTTPPDEKGIRKISLKIAEEAMQKKALVYDKGGEEHYNIISALHKSLRGSDPDAALYWLGRMLAGGEDPLYIARRMVRFASEDIGNADPQALQMAIAAKEAYHFLGSPEGELALAQVAVYLATAPKSNAVYKAFNLVQEDIQRTQTLPAPMHIRNAPTGLMKDLGYGKDYKYPHDFPDHFVDETYLPENLKNRKYYQPTDFGFEKEIKKRLEWWEKKRGQGARDKGQGD
ncbi:MAG: replication-associated recombination protein A [candidate division Zixibacteria bacterium]|nr:replication-associated recombination protein A [candidate division Zixibacteria bacterium]